MSQPPSPDLHGQPGMLKYDPWLHGFTIVVMVATFLLLLAGANVTSRAAGLAVPDWPLSFHSVNPPGWTSNFDGKAPGVRDEHGHRLIGATVGVMVTVLAIWLAVRDPRRWVKWLGLAAFVGVAVQGVMGGLRVTEKSTTLAVVHGCFAQAFFCLIVALVAITSRRWLALASRPVLGPVDRRTEDRPTRLSPTIIEPAANHAQDLALRWSAIGCVLVVYVQVILGAIVRITQATWIPHMSWAVMVGLALIVLVRFVHVHPYAQQALSHATIGVLVLYGIQIILGLATLMVVYPMLTGGTRVPQTALQIWLPTLHLAVGSSILGVTAYLAVRAVGITQRHAPSADLGHELEGAPA